ncbi:YraN family protein [Roseburia sp. OF03-24]|nr:YraN family protein [Roseburia sp. OF03-24]RHF96453.1 YraN family protein [Roseburia sp. AM23-20]UMY99257.1 YraN family protein [Roseburia rectibacter]
MGAAYEKTAGEYLQTKGYEILQYNFRCRMGEIDIIAKDQGYLVFIEVKYRRNSRCGRPAEAVTPKKQRTISKVASYYLLTHGCGMDTPCRFDVAAVSGDEVELIKNAFEYQGYL